MNEPLDVLLAPFGAGPDDIVDLRADLSGPARLDYRDLQRIDPSLRPHGVVRMGGASVAYVVRGEAGLPAQRLLRLRRLLAQRDDAPFLVVVSPGRLMVYGVGLDRVELTDAMVKQIEAHEAFAPATFRWLIEEEPLQANESARAKEGQASPVHRQIFKLLTNAIKGLQDQGVDKPDAVAFAGRALFIRFLLDRGILGGRRKRPMDVFGGATAWEHLFATIVGVQATCGWIDDRFNGDLLTLSEAAFESLDEVGCELLREIVSRRGAQDDFGLQRPAGELDEEFAWGELNFAHIPIGIFSQAYEQQVDYWTPGRRKKDSVFYTPYRVAQYLVREAFARAEARLGEPPARVKVLDPAVGGGVFLIAAFRELAAAHARKTGSWPTSKRLRKILTEQLYGYDIQEEAISFTSLGLYLAAMELDESEKKSGFSFRDLKFDKPLRGNTLFHVADAPLGETAGSLGPAAPDDHFRRFDLVIANPPWTSISERAGARIKTIALDSTRSIVQERLGAARAEVFDYPDNVPDLPFVWRAMQWAKPGGVLAFAVHGRLLFKSSQQGVRAREDLFDAISVWGVLNGADLRHTRVWPNTKAPFCLLMADNAPPPPDHEFFMLSPYFEPGMNASGRLRIDPDAIEPINVGRLRERPWLLKALFRGSRLDVQLLERLRERRWPSLARWMGEHGLELRQGFIRGKKDFRDASHLHGLPRLEADDPIGPVIDAARLPPFDEPEMHRPRKTRAIYEGPLLLIREGIRQDDHPIYVCDTDVAFSRSFYGLSFKGHPDGRRLIRYLALLQHSPIFEWLTLMTGTLGTERDRRLKIEVTRRPIVPFESLSEAQRAQAAQLFARLAADELPEAELLAWTTDLYGLGKRAAEVIADTLATGLPFPAVRAWAAGAPGDDVLAAFVRRLAQRLKPFESVQVELAPFDEADPYRVIVLGREISADQLSAQNARQVLRMAETRGASEAVYHDAATGLVYVGRLAQRRYWTASRARLTAARLVGEGLVGQ